MEIGSVIREKRTAQGLTQEQVATALGVSAPAVSKWERGENFPGKNCNGGPKSV